MISLIRQTERLGKDEGAAVYKSPSFYNWFIRCCTLSFTVRYALINVCSLMTISVVSAFGRLTLEAMAVESVSTMTLQRV